MADTVLNVAKTNLAQSIQIGGTYYQARLASSMIKTDVFEHVWIFDSNKELIIREGNNINNIIPDSLWKRKFYVKDYWPYALIESKVSYHGQHTGTLFVSYRLPLVKSFIILALVTSIFLLLSHYLKTRILNMGENIANPVFAFMTTLEESLRDHKFANKKNGKGIPNDVLNKLGQKGLSYGKVNGTGLGVYDVFEQFDKWNAGIAYATAEGEGTTVKMRFDIAEDNPLYPSEILIAENSTVVILDDDPSVHESWKQRFKELSNNTVTYKYFDSPEHAKLEINNLKDMNKEFLFLGDYDLRHKNTDGIRFIKENDLHDYSILVTSSIDSVIDDCREFEIPVISKSIQGSIDIHTIN